VRRRGADRAPPPQHGALGRSPLGALDAHASLRLVRGAGLFVRHSGLQQ
jgi:hypothetical protein